MTTTKFHGTDRSMDPDAIPTDFQPAFLCCLWRGLLSALPMLLLLFSLMPDADAQTDQVVATVMHSHTKGVGETCHLNEGEYVRFSINLNRKPSRAIHVVYRYTTPTGTINGAYKISENTSTAHMEKTENLIHDPDGVHEYKLEIFENSSSLVGDYQVGTPSVATVLVCDNDSTPVTTPTITIAGGSPVTEGSVAQFTVSATTAPTTALTVNLSVSENEHGGRDFVASTNEGSQTVMIPAGQTSATYDVTTAGDDTDEPNGTITVTVNAGTDYQVGNPASGTVTVRDDDSTPVTTPTITIAGGSPVTEGSAAQFTVSATTAPTTALTVNLSVSENEHGGRDFVASTNEGSQTVMIPAGQTSATYDVTTAGDDTDEPNGTITVTVNAGTDYQVGNPASGTVTVRDDDSVENQRNNNNGDNNDRGGSDNTAQPTNPPPQVIPTIDVTIIGSTITEGSAVRFTVSTTPVLTSALTVNLMISENEHGGRDFVASTNEGSKTVTIPAGQTSSVDTLVTVDDDTDEPDGTVTVTVQAKPDYHVGDPASGTITVRDNDRVVMPTMDTAAAISLLRFGRTVTGQVLDSILHRVDSLDAPATPRMSGHLLGIPVGQGTPSAAERTGEWHRDADRNVMGKNLFTGKGFNLADGTKGNRMIGLWGANSLGEYEGREGTVRVSGDADTLLLGHDVSGTLPGERRWLAGLVASKSIGDGDWTGDSKSPEMVKQRLMALVPYGAVDVSENLRLWASAGRGTGKMALASGSTAYTGHSKTAWSMLAGGFRQDLLSTVPDGRESLTDGFGLSLNGDIRQTRTESAGSPTLPSGSGTASRLRLALEGSLRRVLMDGSVMDPSLELGFRRDTGDAETGHGLEVGAGISWITPQGLAVSVEGRSLATHRDEDFRDRSLSAVLDWDPRPDNGRGLSIVLGLDVGDGTGSDTLQSDTVIPGPDSDVTSNGQKRWRTQVAYGLWSYGHGLLGSPYLMLAGENRLEEARFGYRVGAASARGIDLGVDLHVRDHRGSEGFGAGLALSFLW